MRRSLRGGAVPPPPFPPTGSAGLAGSGFQRPVLPRLLDDESDGSPSDDDLGFLRQRPHGLVVLDSCFAILQVLCKIAQMLVSYVCTCMWPVMTG